MSHPTGMGANTGLRYNRIAAEMMDFVNNNGQQPRSRRAPSQRRYAPAADHYARDPVVGYGVRDFAIRFVRNLLTR